jgi:hypothetical protein
MFGRRNRKHVEALDDLREEFSAADRNARAVLADAIAQIELRMARDREEGDATRLATEAAVENAQSLLTAQANDVGLLLQQVANTCELVVERLEADRLERRAYVEAIGRLMQSPALEAGERPVGGTVFPPEIAADVAPDSETTADANVAEVPTWAEPPVRAAAAEEDTIDLNQHEEQERTSRTLPRWVTKRF